MVNAKEFYGQLGVHFNALQYSQKRLNYRRMYAENEPYSQLPGATSSGFFLLLLFPCYFESILLKMNPITFNWMVVNEFSMNFYR